MNLRIFIRKKILILNSFQYTVILKLNYETIHAPRVVNQLDN